MNLKEDCYAMYRVRRRDPATAIEEIVEHFRKKYGEEIGTIYGSWKTLTNLGKKAIDRYNMRVRRGVPEPCVMISKRGAD